MEMTTDARVMELMMEQITHTEAYKKAAREYLFNGIAYNIWDFDTEGIAREIVLELKDIIKSPEAGE